MRPLRKFEIRHTRSTVVRVFIVLRTGAWTNGAHVSRRVSRFVRLPEPDGRTTDSPLRCSRAYTNRFVSRPTHGGFERRNRRVQSSRDIPCCVITRQLHRVGRIKSNVLSRAHFSVRAKPIDSNRQKQWRVYDRMFLNTFPVRVIDNRESPVRCVLIIIRFVVFPLTHDVKRLD